MALREKREKEIKKKKTEEDKRGPRGGERSRSSEMLIALVCMNGKTVKAYGIYSVGLEIRLTFSSFIRFTGKRLSIRGDWFST